MAYCSKKKWTEFSLDIEELRPVLSIWLEAVLSKQVMTYNGSDSVIYEPNNWSKYKLVPYDVESMPPLNDLDEGILICLDSEILGRLCSNVPLEHKFSIIPWHTQELTYKVFNQERLYRVVPLPISCTWDDRKKILFNLAGIIRSMEKL